MQDRLAYIGIFILNIITIASATAAEPFIETGQWKIEIAVQVDGKPNATPTVYMQCVNDLQALIQILNPQRDCLVLNTLVTGKDISWDISCVAEANTTKGSAKLIKSANNLHGKLEMRVGIPGTSFNMFTVRTIHATRISDCPSSTSSTSSK